MAQITTGIRKILSQPVVYNLTQRVLGGHRGRIRFVNQILKLEANTVMLDIGSGTSELLEYFPDDIEYYGYDISEEYIRFARDKYHERNAVFRAKIFDEGELEKIPSVDVVFAGGLLHHLDDSEVSTLMSLAASALEKQGRFISIDPCYIEKQNPIAKILIDRDRGQNVRHPSELESIAAKHFTTVKCIHRADFMKIPYDHVVLDCSAQ